MKLLITFLCLALALHACAPQQAIRKSAVLSPDLAAHVEKSERRGREIYELENAVWRLQDPIIAFQTENPDFPPIGGWVTDRKGDQIIVGFVHIGEDGIPKVRLIGIMVDDEVVGINPLEEGIPFTPAQQAQWTASASINDLGLTACGEDHNPVAFFESSASGSPSETRLMVYPVPNVHAGETLEIGSFYRLEFSADGETLLGQRRLHEECKDVSLVPEKEGLTAMGMVITNRSIPAPLESHVFLSLALGIDVFVVTDDDTIWSVSGSDISLFD